MSLESMTASQLSAYAKAWTNRGAMLKFLPDVVHRDIGTSSSQLGLASSFATIARGVARGCESPGNRLGVDSLKLSLKTAHQLLNAGRVAGAVRQLTGSELERLAVISDEQNSPLGVRGAVTELARRVHQPGEARNVITSLGERQARASVFEELGHSLAQRGKTLEAHEAYEAAASKASSGQELLNLAALMHPSPLLEPLRKRIRARAAVLDRAW